MVSPFFAKQPKAGESIVVAIDGKTLRGTIPAGASRGKHLLAAYLPEEGRRCLFYLIGTFLSIIL